ncbi:MAG: S8 family serine peptidase [Oculatellaceae cyanobacterium bins.114]|nr:S8 family serine peptidase [Oculatellaceae cyanobacterium bins.114]
MTGSVVPPNSSGAGQGVAPENEGIILQRGGEELALEKVGDRFTVRLIEGRNSQALAQQVGARGVQLIESVQLVEFQVDPARLDQGMQLARTSADVVFASHVYRLQNSPSTLVYLTDQVTVQFAGQVNTASVEAIANPLGLQRAQPVIGIPQTFVFELTDRARSNPIKLANQLMRRPEVLTAEPNVAVKTQSLYRPRDPEYPKQWYLHHSGGSELATNSHISVEAAWDITRGVRSIIVAITDDGFDLNHPDFQGKDKIVAPRDLKQGGNTPFPDDANENHGTACAGLAIAEENNVGIVGVAPGCAFMPIRTTGFLDDEAIEGIFNWAIQNGAAVISCSWGSSLTYYPLSLRQRAVITRAATQGRNGKGCVVVFAAGNSNRPVNGTVNEQGWTNDVLRGSTSWLSGFAVHPDVIAVAASTSLNKKAAYSNWGSNISIAAPSNNAPPGVYLQDVGYTHTGPQIRSALPGKGVYSSDRTGAAGYTPSNFTADFGGTSSACPIIAGVAALVLSINPNLTAKDVKQILQDSADKIVDPDPDPQLGFRRGTYDANGHSQWFGYGKVNAFKAVQMAQRRLTPPTPTPKPPTPTPVTPTPTPTPAVVTRRIQQQNNNPFNIPDFNPQGISSLISINDASRIKDLQVNVDIEHSFLGDLEISLISPQGVTVLLQSRILGRQTRLQKTYSPQTTPFLGRLINQPAAGRWQLQIIDFAQLNTGRLKSWQLNIGV